MREENTRNGSIAAMLESIPQRKRWAVMRFVRRKLKAMRPVMSCADLGRQSGLDREVVRQLIHACLKPDELKVWKILVHLPKRCPVRIISRNPDPKSAPKNGRKCQNRSSHIHARRWERYAQSQLGLLLSLAVANFKGAILGECAIISYYELRRRTGVAVCVIGDYLLHAQGAAWFLKRNSLAHNHRLPKAE